MRIFLALAAMCSLLLAAAFISKPNQKIAAAKPNIVVIMADDMGFSDIGCYGGEIPTPNIDELANRGIRFSQFYNNARCCPTRASLLTGLHPHQAGIGRMAEDPENPAANDEGVDGYRGYLSKNTVTIPEVLKTAGYHTYMSGKWHVGMHGKEKWPLQRGFERFYGVLSGGSSYLKPFPPRGITADNGETQYDFPENYYTTDAFTENAVQFIQDQKDSNPFFLYLAYTAPHWPLQAKKEDIALFAEKYKAGWDSVGRERLRKQLAMGLTKPEWGTAQREMRPWKELTAKEQDEVAYRMAVYAAQVYSMDQNIGKVIKTLKAQKKFDNTLVVFLSDNGGCAEPYAELGGKPLAEVNDPSKFWLVSYGTGWANTSNLPFKKWKNSTYEGGLSTPFIACWPDGIKSQAGKWSATPYHVIDLMKTFTEIGGAEYPKTFKGNNIIPTEGISMLPAFKTGAGKSHEYFYWEHEENCAVRRGDWKGVKRLPSGAWELYNLKNDRTERHNLAAQHPDIVKDLDEKWQTWADSHKVFPKGKNYKQAAAQPARRPNILFLFADDLRADALSIAGNTVVKTPNIDQLANSGTRFTNCYVMGGHHGAICQPSRAMLMSGKSLFHVYDVLDGVHTMPQHFAENGYETFGTGKWHNGGQTFEASFQKGKTVMLGGMSDHFKVPVRDLDANRKLGEPVTRSFSTDIFTESALSYLDEYAKGDKSKPFFCYVAFTAPHDPRSPREDYIGKYPEKDIPLPGNYKPVHPFDYGEAQVRDENLAAWPRTPEIIKATLSDYYGLISHLDNRIGDLIQSLKNKGLYENTIIIFAADNGLAVGSHGLLGKQSLYEHSMKVPFMIAGPGIPQKQTSEALVYLYDIFPTLTSLTGQPKPQNIDGQSLADIISKKSAGVRASSFTAYRNLIRAVRDEEWKLIRYPERDYTQLFNLKKDPLELENLAGKPQYRQKEEDLKKLLISWQQQTGDTMAYTAKKILPIQYEPEKFKRTMDAHQPKYTQEKYWND